MVRTENKIQQNSMGLDDCAVSEQVGYVILLGIIVTGLSIIVLMNMPAVNSSQDNAQFSHIVQAFTTADSKISKARFSTSIYQETPFQLNEGAVTVDGSDTDSYIEIYKETMANPYIYRTALGTLKSVTDHGVVAYQDGGVWESSPTGGSVMISPPDFDYNGETLTLPIMSIVGSESLATSAGGKVLVDIESIEPTPIYPGGVTGGTNPVEEGKDIIIKIKSDYYLAWADFINERTKATATVDPVNKIVICTLKTGAPTQSGRINMGLNTKHMETDNDYAPILAFTMHLEKRNPGKDYFISLHPPATVPPYDPYLEIETDRIKGPGKENVAIIYKYTDTANGIYEAFSTTLAFDSSTEYNTLDIDMLSNSIPMMYGDEDGDGNPDNNVDATSTTWGINPTAMGDSGTFTGITDGNDVIHGVSKTLSDVTQHYLRLMSEKYPEGPDYYAYGTEKGNNNQKIHYDPQQSDFLLKFNSKQDLRYLYVTKGDINVNLRTAG